MTFHSEPGLGMGSSPTQEKENTGRLRTMNTLLRRAVRAPARVVQRRTMGGHHGPKPVYEGLEAKIRVYLPENHHVRAKPFHPEFDAILRRFYCAAVLICVA